MSPALEHIVWDWNGTLLDDLQACVAAINRLLDQRGLPRTDPERYRDRFGFPVRAYYQALGFDLAHEDWDRLAHDFHVHYRADGSYRVRPAAPAVLGHCQALGLGQSLLSACEQVLLETLLAPTGLRPFFTRVQGVDNLHGASKLAVGRALLESLGLPPNRILMVGDTLHDHEVAEALGCPCLLVCDGHQSPARLRRSGRPLIATLDELPDWLSKSQSQHGGIPT